MIQQFCPFCVLARAKSLLFLWKSTVWCLFVLHPCYAALTREPRVTYRNIVTPNWDWGGNGFFTKGHLSSNCLIKVKYCLKDVVISSIVASQQDSMALPAVCLRSEKRVTLHCSIDVCSHTYKQLWSDFSSWPEVSYCLLAAVNCTASQKLSNTELIASALLFYASQTSKLSFSAKLSFTTFPI